jgi:hypothetical protein
MENQAGMFAAIGDDGIGVVVWGVGGTPDEALADAARWTNDTPADLEIAKISLAQYYRIIDYGETSWPMSE